MEITQENNNKIPQPQGFLKNMVCMCVRKRDTERERENNPGFLSFFKNPFLFN